MRSTLNAARVKPSSTVILVTPMTRRKPRPRSVKTPLRAALTDGLDDLAASHGDAPRRGAEGDALPPRHVHGRRGEDAATARRAAVADGDEGHRGGPAHGLGESAGAEEAGAERAPPPRCAVR